MAVASKGLLHIYNTFISNVPEQPSASQGPGCSGEILISIGQEDSRQNVAETTGEVETD